MTPTDVLAIIGAVTGIIGTITGVSAIVWDFYKWRNAERVRLKVAANLNFVSTDNPHKRMLMISVTNIGKVSTTIKMLSFHGFDTKKELKKRMGKETSVMLTPLHGQLPARLNAGDDWTGASSQDELSRYQKYKYFVVQIEDSISDFPFRAIVDLSEMKK